MLINCVHPPIAANPRESEINAPANKVTPGLAQPFVRPALRIRNGFTPVRDLRYSRRLEIVNGSRPYSLAASTARQIEDIPVAPCRGLFPLTPALSLGERVNLSPHGEQSRHLGLPLRDARCSLSLRERARVRENGANDALAYRTIPGTVELDGSSGEAGVSQNDNEIERRPTGWSHHGRLS